jgi:hypothetical protein
MWLGFTVVRTREVASAASYSQDAGAARGAVMTSPCFDAAAKVGSTSGQEAFLWDGAGNMILDRSYANDAVLSASSNVCG